MANAYPTLGMTHATRHEVQDGRIPVRATNGSLRVRRLYASDKHAFDIEHALNATDKGTLATFYTNNADVEVDFTDPATGTTYTCLFASAPKHVPQQGGWFLSYVQLEQT